MSTWTVSLRNDRRRDLDAERREEGEGKHHAAELGEDAGRGDDELAQQPVRIAADDRPGEQPADDRAGDGRAEGELDRPAERLDEDAVA